MSRMVSTSIHPYIPYLVFLPIILPFITPLSPTYIPGSSKGLLLCILTGYPRYHYITSIPINKDYTGYWIPQHVVIPRLKVVNRYSIAPDSYLVRQACLYIPHTPILIPRD